MSTPVMPNPKRVASANIAVLRRMGFTKHQAAVLIFQICAVVAQHLERQGIPDTDWIDLVGTYAMEHTSIYRQQAVKGGQDT